MISIRVDEAKKVAGRKSAFINFPYNDYLVNRIREESSRFWHKESKEWEIPDKRLGAFVNDASSLGIEIVAEVKKEVTEDVKLPKGFNFKTKPYQHQIEGLEYGLKNDHFILADDQGLGKTKQVIDIAVAKKISKGFKYCLIICGVNGLKWNWQSEIAIHSNEKSHILGTRYTKRGKAKIGSAKDKLQDLVSPPEGTYFLITNVESLRDEAFSKKVAELCKKNVIELVAFDEIHKCKNPTSQQGKGLLRIKPKSTIAMSGTPLMNSPLDLYIVLKWLDFEKHTFTQFKKHYCNFGGYGGYEIVGYKNLNELKENMESVSLRRLKKDVLDLPEKVYHTEYVEMSKKQKAIYDEVYDELKTNIDKVKVSPNPLAQTIRLRQATGYTGILSSEVQESAKLDRMEELVEDLVENGEKCIIFSNWTDMTTPVFKRLKKFNPAIITGETKDRKGEETRFMTDNKCKVIIGTIGAMGTGLTLTAATTVIFLDSPWNKANKEQAVDRAHRIGTKSTVNIITLVCKDTIDERIEELVEKKGKMAEALVDGKFDLSRSEVLDFLLT